MGSKAQDTATQSASSQAAQQASAQQVASATQNQQNSNQQYAQVNQNLAPVANPSSLTSPTLNSTYKNAYTTVAGQNAQAAQEAVQTSMQQQNNRGMGATPAGFAADEARKAYQTQAGQNATAYTANAQQQQADAINNYQYANTQLANEGANQQQAAVSNLAGGANTNTSLYGTASQQKQTAAGAILGAAAGVGAAAVGVKR